MKHRDQETLLEKMDPSTPEFYDAVFRHSKAYLCPPEDSVYYPLWIVVLDLIKGSTLSFHVKILDVGCGPGQFARLCTRAGHEYVGLDWSRVAIETGRKGPGVFYLVDVQQDRARFKGDYDVATFIEFLEHVPNDLEILADVPQGRTIILTVPDYPSKEHFRFFSDIDQVVRRYQNLVLINGQMILSAMNWDEPAQIFVLRGIRR